MPPSRRRTFALAGGGIAALALAVFLFVWFERRELWAQVDTLQADVTQLDAEIGKHARVRTAVEAVEKWRSGDAMWLEELRWLSERFPPAAEAMVTDLTLALEPSGPEMKFQMLAKSSDAVRTAEQKLRNAPPASERERSAERTITTSISFNSAAR